MVFVRYGSTVVYLVEKVKQRIHFAELEQQIENAQR
jgi:hypothetical protein